MEDFVTIAHFNNLAEAYTMRALLEASDVPVLVLDDQTAGVNWLVIPEVDIEYYKGKFTIGQPFPTAYPTQNKETGKNRFQLFPVAL